MFGCWLDEFAPELVSGGGRGSTRGAEDMAGRDKTVVQLEKGLAGLYRARILTACAHLRVTVSEGGSADVIDSE